MARPRPDFDHDRSAAAANAAAVLACPNCGNDDVAEILWQEWIASVRNVVGVATVDEPDGKTAAHLLVDSESYKDDPGGCTGKDEQLLCLRCDHAWDVPDAFAVMHDDVQHHAETYGEGVIRR